MCDCVIAFLVDSLSTGDLCFLIQKIGFSRSYFHIFSVVVSALHYITLLMTNILLNINNFKKEVLRILRLWCIFFAVLW